MSQEKLSPVMKKVLDHVNAINYPTTPKIVSIALGIPHGTAKYCLAQLWRMNLVKRIGRTYIPINYQPKG